MNSQVSIYSCHYLCARIMNAVTIVSSQETVLFLGTVQCVMLMILPQFALLVINFFALSCLI
uniref:G_PROTEIN_RECEP_F1_2 domain-containing protein n=1 Tax=Elaeophora elaphi TaxID=1147741 RepID=A0A0R3S681_9BILA